MASSFFMLKALSVTALVLSKRCFCLSVRRNYRLRLCCLRFVLNILRLSLMTVQWSRLNLRAFLRGMNLKRLSILLLVWWVYTTNAWRFNLRSLLKLVLEFALAFETLQRAWSWSNMMFWRSIGSQFTVTDCSSEFVVVDILEGNRILRLLLLPWRKKDCHNYWFMTYIGYIGW